MIPTVSDWGMIVMTLLGCMFRTLVYRNCRAATLGGVFDLFDMATGGSQSPIDRKKLFLHPAGQRAGVCPSS